MVNGDGELRGLGQMLLNASTADHTEVWFGRTSEGSARFANNEIVQSTAKHTRTAEVRVAFGKRVGCASTSCLAESELLTVLRRAEAMARSSGEDHEYMPPPGPQVYPRVEAWDDETAALSPERRTKAIRTAIRLAEEAGVRCSGSYVARADHEYLANSSGLEFEHARTHNLYGNTYLSQETTGWAKRFSIAASNLDVEGAARAALGKATRFGSLAEVEPGEYTVVLEPCAFADLLSHVQWSLDAKEADEGRSGWHGLVGERIGSELFTARSIPAHPANPGQPSIEDGLAAPDVTWFANGVLKTLAYTRYWAERSGVAPTGGAGSFVVEGGAKSVEDLVAGVGRGLLVTRFWYLNFTDEMKLMTTGMTRDGLFLIENGEVVAAVRNLRFDDSPLRFLKHIVEVGREEVAVNEAFDEAIVCPPVRIDGFAFTSGTSF